jgi:hypothetical protein
MNDIDIKTLPLTEKAQLLKQLLCDVADDRDFRFRQLISGMHRLASDLTLATIKARKEERD